MRWDIGIDLGTENVRMCELKLGPVLSAPSAMAFREGRESPICTGELAEHLIGRTCEGVSVHYPLRDGVLENTFYAERLFHWMYHESHAAARRRRFNVVVTCAPDARAVQRDSLLASAIAAGASEAMLVRSDVAAAVGAELDIAGPQARLLVHLGAGRITATLFTFGRVAAYGSLPYGMNRVDERIQHLLRANYGYRVGRAAAVEIKHTLGNALPDKAPKDIIMHSTGVNMAKRLPMHFDVETQPVLDACEDVTAEIVRLCQAVTDSAPEELAADLTDTGAVLTGGGAAMTELDRRLGQALGIPCRAADAPETCAVRGLAKILEAPEAYYSAFQDQSERNAWR